MRREVKKTYECSLSRESGTLWIFKPFCPCQRERFLSIGKIQFALSKSIMFSFLFSTEKIPSVRSQFFNHRLISLRICPASIPLNPWHESRVNQLALPNGWPTVEWKCPNICLGALPCSFIVVSWPAKWDNIEPITDNTQCTKSLLEIQNIAFIISSKQNANNSGFFEAVSPDF